MPIPTVPILGQIFDLFRIKVEFYLYGPVPGGPLFVTHRMHFSKNHFFCGFLASKMVGIRNWERIGSSQERIIDDENRARRPRVPLAKGCKALARYRSRLSAREKSILAAVDRARRQKVMKGRWARAPRNLKVNDRVKIRRQNVEGPVEAFSTANCVSKTQKWVILKVNGTLTAFPLELCKRV